MIEKALNKMVTGDNFQDKDTDNYIYASISQPPLKILDKNNSDDELDFTVQCPNCHRAVNFGTEIYMISGHHYCDNDDCRERVKNRVVG